MKATSLLASHHRRVRQLLGAVERERYVRRALLGNLADDLTATLEVKETVFYPAVRGALALPCFDDNASLARAALQRCFDAADDEGAFASALAALSASIEGPFEAEERDLFPRVEQGLPPVELERLGERMRSLYCEILDTDGDERISSIGRPSRADWYLFDSNVP